MPSHPSDLGNNLNLDVYVSKQWNENNVTNPGDIIGSIASPKNDSDDTDYSSIARIGEGSSQNQSGIIEGPLDGKRNGQIPNTDLLQGLEQRPDVDGMDVQEHQEQDQEEQSQSSKDTFLEPQRNSSCRGRLAANQMRILGNSGPSSSIPNNQSTRRTAASRLDTEREREHPSRQAKQQVNNKRNLRKGKQGVKGQQLAQGTSYTRQPSEQRSKIDPDRNEKMREKNKHASKKCRDKRTNENYELKIKVINLEKKVACMEEEMKAFKGIVEKLLKESAK